MSPWRDIVRPEAGPQLADRYELGKLLGEAGEGGGWGTGRVRARGQGRRWGRRRRCRHPPTWAVLGRRPPTAGKGAFGVVHLGIDRDTRELYAVKSISKAKLINPDDVRARGGGGGGAATARTAAPPAARAQPWWGAGALFVIVGRGSNHPNPSPRPCPPPP